MIAETRSVLALAAMIVATGVLTVELTRNSAEADPRFAADSAATYPGDRIDTVFDLVAVMPETAPVVVPIAEKGDLPMPAGCEGQDQAECMDVAYEVESVPSIVVETRSGNISTLMRMDALEVAGINEEPALRHD